MIRIIITGDQAQAIGPFPFRFVRLIGTLSGRKIWNAAKSVTFDANTANLNRLKESEFKATLSFEDTGGEMAAAEALENLPTQHSPQDLKIKYEPKVPWLKHQRDTLSLSWNREAYAHFHEMGLGKTAINIAEAGILNFKKRVSGFLVLSPKGVHRQWIEEQVPRHISDQITWSGIIWNGKMPEPKEMNKKGLVIFSMNIDAIRTEKGFAAAEAFLLLHRGRSLMTIDESDAIKAWNAQRTKAAWELGELATFRRIMTGTPISKNIIDAWSQFKFLDIRILGHKYMTSFRSQYCVMGGFEGRQIVGQKNTEQFYQLIAPHSYRITKREVLDLPEKFYSIREYDMGEKTLKHYRSIKDTLMTSLDNGDILDVPNAAAAVMRLQQVVCGYLPTEDEGVEIISDERIQILIEMLNQIEGKVIIWHRFIEDGKRIREAINREFGERSAVEYRGHDHDRAAAKERFIKGNATYFIANPQAGGTGVDGLQTVCQAAIYFSNSFRARDRWQSEDRIDRMGMKGSAYYYDIVANRSVDKGILRNLRGKKSVSDLTLDEIRKMVAEM